MRFSTLVLIFFCHLASAQVYISPELEILFNNGDKSDAIIIFRDQADLSAARFIKGKDAKSKYVYSVLESTAARTQAKVIELLRAKNINMNTIVLVNAIAVEDIDQALARQLAQFPEIKSIVYDPWVQFEQPNQQDVMGASDRSGVTWGIERINAPLAWNAGFRGQGITVGGADTGIEWEHPAIKTHYRGWNANTNIADHEYNWFDAVSDQSPLNGDPANPCGFSSPIPCDDNSHGTHTVGTMVGDDGQDNQIGVAPGAVWIGCRNMERGWGRPSTYIGCFEWFLAPTNLNGENPDPLKSPHVINNSWYCADIEGCTSIPINELMRTAIINLKLAGIFVVVSNGNFGPSCSSSDNPPAYFEESFSVGATRQDDTIAIFSSRGPVLIDGSLRVKPNVAAPGVGVNSCVRGGGYASWQGTSMAGPHVAGLVALVLSARPDFAGEVDLLEDMIEQTSIAMADTAHCTISGDSRPNMAYGFGRIDAWAAVQYALDWVVDNSTTTSTPISVLVSPNPVSEWALFHVKNGHGKAIINLFDNTGKRLINQVQNIQSAQEIIPVSVQNLSSGIYFWELQMGAQTVTGKLMR